MCKGSREQNSDPHGQHSLRGCGWCREAAHVLVWPRQDGDVIECRMGTAPARVPSSAEQRGNAAGAPATASPSSGRKDQGDRLPD